MSRRVLLCLALLAIGVFGCGRRSADSSIAQDVQTFPDLGGEHLTAAEVQHILAGDVAPPAYNSNPPTSGAHAPQAAACGIFRQPVPDVYQLHNLELGVVVIQYSPSLEAIDVESIEKFARGLGDRYIVAPRPGLGSAVAATAWTRLLILDTIDQEELAAFYGVYVGQVPNPGECPAVVDEGT